MNDYQQSLRQQEEELEEIVRREERESILGILRRLAAMPETESRRALMKGWVAVLEEAPPLPRPAPPGSRGRDHSHKPLGIHHPDLSHVPQEVGPTRLMDLDADEGETH